MAHRGTACAVLLALVCAGAEAQERRIPPEQIKSGSAFSSPEVRSLEQDVFANPGMLWVERGARTWSERSGSAGRSCASCHGDARASMKGVAARYPAVDRASGKLLDLGGRIQQCRAVRQGAAALRHESDELLALAAFVAFQSRGMPIETSVEGAAREHFEAGRRYFYTRRGQMNLTCAQCHEENWGKRLLAETISQGHPNAFPAYRLEWQTMGSLARRLRACLSGIRAEMLPYGSPEYLDLELFLAWRARGLPVETPGVRR